MSRISEHDKQMGNPQMRPADLRGADSVVLTVADVTYKKSEFRTRGQDAPNKYVLSFNEIPEREVWLNKTGLNLMCGHYGDETDDWKGKPVPLRAVFVNVQGTQRHVVQVAQDWEDVMKAAGVSTRARRSTKKGRK